ncbi:hypothetical protein CcI49_33890 [Frankia sp. CcI49]|uniref:toll/interleukin-1 receptor domain-containing protein n=1 Tax=Frankia sp. CcI49 TaxID=1745382 RepID=UPI00097833C4|nr:toll/interleukin-1 receptor domain-containing protein [Frankia sp. CcI49]ONH52516.1 hypothetical protein CcI49_33890 [Frankia sp. CcI49]
MNAAADTDTGDVARRRSDVLAELPDGPVALASHAAVPVVVDARLLHLLRVNFFLDDEPLDYAVEADLLLSPVFRDIGDGLFEIEPELRRFLLTSLRARYGMDRVLAVANLLWQYAEQTGTWRHRPELEKAQQLTALHLLDPEAAERWLAESESTAGTEHSLAPGWFAAMRYQFAHQPDLSRIPDVEAALPTIDESKIAAMNDAQRRAVQDALLVVCSSRDRLDELLHRLERPSAHMLERERGPMTEVVFKVVGEAQAEGWLAHLLTEAAREYPASRQLADVVRLFESSGRGVADDTPVDSLTRFEVQALAAVYSERTVAGQLLSRAGLKPEQQPPTTPIEIEYWHAVNATLVRGVLPGARLRILTLAARDFPANKAFQTGMAAAQHAESVADSPRDASPEPRTDGGLPANSTVIAFDTVGDSDRNIVEMRRLRQIIESSLIRAKIPRALQQQDRGDDYPMVFSADIPKAWIVVDFVRELVIALRAYNSTRDDRDRIRLRVAMHEGQNIVDPGTAWADEAVVTCARLVDSAPIRDALQRNRDADLALILSSKLFDTVVRPGFHGLSPDDYREVAVSVKSFTGTAWLTLPGRGAPSTPMIGPSNQSLATGTATGPESREHTGGLDAPVRPDGTRWDFFVSAVSADEAWSRWIAWQLQDEYLVRADAWYPTGTNRISALEESLRFSARVVVVLSQAYLEADDMRPVWQAVLSRDPGGLHRSLILVRVEECEPEGLLRGIRYIDLVPFANDADGAREYLIDEIRRLVEGSSRPSTAPPFPG